MDLDSKLKRPTADSFGSPTRPEPKQAEFSLFVRYLPDDAKLEELVAAFSPFGQLLPSTRLFSMKRIGFVDFENEDGLKAAERATIRVRNTIVACERAVAKGGMLPAVAIDKRRQIDKARGRVPSASGIEQSPRSNSWKEEEETETKPSPGSQESTPTRRSPRQSYDSGTRRSAISIRSELSFEEDEKHDSHTEDDAASDEAGNVHCIYVGGVPETLSKDDMDLWLIATLPDGYEGKFRFVRSSRPSADRIGFIDFPSFSKARAALEILRGSKVKGHRLRLEMARSPPTKPKLKASSSSREVFYARIPHVPPGTTLDDIRWAYAPFGRISEIIMKNLDLNSGELIGEPLEVAPAEPKLLLASLTFEKADDAMRAAMQSQTPAVDMLQVIRDGDSLDVIVGPFPPTMTLAQVARSLSKFGNLSGARLVKKTTACLIAFENELSAHQACENTVLLKGVHVTAIGHHVY